MHGDNPLTTSVCGQQVESSCGQPYLSAITVDLPIAVAFIMAVTLFWPLVPFCSFTAAGIHAISPAPFAARVTLKMPTEFSGGVAQAVRAAVDPSPMQTIIEAASSSDQEDCREQGHNAYTYNGEASAARVCVPCLRCMGVPSASHHP